MIIPEEVIDAIYEGRHNAPTDLNFDISIDVAREILGWNLEFDGGGSVENPEVNKAFEFLDVIAKRISSDAYYMLPDNWIFNPSGAPNVDAISIHSLKRKWQMGSDGVKLEIARMISREFKPTHDSKGNDDRQIKEVDLKPRIVNTSLNRVLPNKYGKWIRENGTDNFPNCLGKYQLLVALGDYLNVPMLCIATTKEHYIIANELKLHMATEILSFFKRHNLTLSEERESSIKRSIAYVKSLESISLFQHLSIAFRASENKWIVIDPNMGISSIDPAEWELEQKYSLIQKNKRNCPLMSFQVTSDQVSEICSPAKQTFDEKLLDIEQNFGAILANIAVPEGTERNLAIENFFYKALKSIWGDMETDLQIRKEMATLQHPAVEICDVHMRLASATLSHVAYEISAECGDTVEQILFALGIVQGHLYNVASSILRHPSWNREFSNLAFLVLERIPVLSVMNEGLLKGRMQNANN